MQGGDDGDADEEFHDSAEELEVEEVDEGDDVGGKSALM